ncbi:hypothetical protein [Streptomyces sp. NPDC050848]|uniref:hypothetical protein n=1 Tax=Streptomyces sp. NPDC050848 TaxID=3155791 RepID=UPI0033E10915
MRVQHTLGKRLVQSAVAVGVGAALVAVANGPASAATIAAPWDRGDLAGVYAWGTTNADCDITFNVKDTRADGNGAGLEIWVNDGSDRRYRVTNHGGSGSTISGSRNYANDAAVSVRTFRTDGGVPVAWGGWRTLC